VDPKDTEEQALRSSPSRGIRRRFLAPLALPLDRLINRNKKTSARPKMGGI
jgi:hypothetical protein